MPRVSTVKRLPSEIREEIHRLLESGQKLDAIVEHLRSMGVSEVSRSRLAGTSRTLSALWRGPAVQGNRRCAGPALWQRG
jgi:hypothetical protein